MNNMLEYLSALESNNNREWYHANKDQFQKANAVFEQLVEKLVISIGQFDAAIIHHIPKELTFRLARDTRFSNDKPPYNPTFRACIAPAGKLPIPVGYYIAIAPDNRSFLGGGLHEAVFKDATIKIRDYIVGHGSKFESIINNKDFLAHFSVKGEALKNVPRGYDETHPQAEYLKLKTWYIQFPLLDNSILSEDFVEEAVRIFHVMKPFNDYLNTALKGVQMPNRAGGKVCPCRHPAPQDVRSVS
ncbi:MAG: DUF2461 domain-containing protein [Desulfovibrio sp.]|jgi:uncharacterized protein (TIGR02453 family)|nr:DUF2461 domain-containing protein [Desulfovibrio sp.]